MEKVEDRLANLGVIPVAVVDVVADALPLADALAAGGLPCAEVTFRTEAAAAAIEAIATARPDMLLGAGTVLSKNQVVRAVGAGARFIVSPGFDAELVDYCINEGIPVFPGCATASEITQAVKRGLRVLKFFPSEQLGGVPMMKSLGAPFGSVRFLPTGGINANNLRTYLTCERVVACGGTWIAKSAMIRRGQFDVIERLARQSAEIVAEARGCLDAGERM